MGSIFFYTVEDWVAAYLWEWGYRDPKLVREMTARLQKNQHNLHPDDVTYLMNNEVSAYLDVILPETGLDSMQRLHYFKMVFLVNRLYEKYDLFRGLSADSEKQLIAVFQSQMYQAAPDLIHADMFRQSIKTFHPFWKIKKTFAKGVSKGLRLLTKRK